MAKYSTDRLTDELEKHRLMLLWHIQRSMQRPQVACATCGHDFTDHVDDEGQLCMFPASRGAPGVLCRCYQFLDTPAEQQDDDDDHQDDQQEPAADVDTVSE